LHIYQVRPRKDHRGVSLTSDAPPSVGCGTTILTQSGMQSAMRSFSAAHMMLWFAFAIRRAMRSKRTNKRAISESG